MGSKLMRTNASLHNNGMYLFLELLVYFGLANNIFINQLICILIHQIQLRIVLGFCNLMITPGHLFMKIQLLHAYKIIYRMLWLS